MYSGSRECRLGGAILVGSVELSFPTFKMTVFEALAWFFGVVTIGCPAVLGLSRLCRRWLGTANPKYSTFSVVELRGLRDRGEVTPEEFEALIRKLFVPSGKKKGNQSSCVSDK